ncbi:hypothetical protein JMJ35_004118 [Cladonia borealis]|uniref:Uncharacterized protein n=1 Tax=Cladonia borealis TaxID=184061 RepID=A0AA39V2C0_9LECA|nr:hypothetical protein JMJ35_004118 [Cladonia borealis]
MILTVIAEDGDLIVEVVQYSEDTWNANSNPVSEEIAQFRVDRNVLIKASQPLLKMLLDPKWKEANQSVLSLNEGRVVSTEIWLRVIHKATINVIVPFREIWHLVAAIDYYDLDITKFNPWFAAWYSECNTQLLKPRELLFPTWRFDHAKGFARWTRYLAYEEKGHITEANPAKLWSYHLPGRIIQQLNAAKGRLRTVLHRGLFRPCEHLFSANCKCRKETLYDYQKHLVDIDVWPLETVFQRTPMNEILDRLEKFNFEAKLSACGACRRDYKSPVEETVEFVRYYFDGLCLDCLNRSKPKLKDPDMDYWRHHTLKEHEWITGCRFRHKQPTWYFSFMGRKEDRDRFMGRRRRDSDSD